MEAVGRSFVVLKGRGLGKAVSRRGQCRPRFWQDDPGQGAIGRHAVAPPEQRPGVQLSSPGPRKFAGQQTGLRACLRDGQALAGGLSLVMDMTMYAGYSPAEVASRQA